MLKPGQRAAIAESDRERAGKPKMPKIHADSGMTKADLVGHEHLAQSQHFSGPKAPMTQPSGVPQRDGLGAYADSMSKKII